MPHRPSRLRLYEEGTAVLAAILADKGAALGEPGIPPLGLHRRAPRTPTLVFTPPGPGQYRVRADLETKRWTVSMPSKYNGMMMSQAFMYWSSVYGGGTFDIEHHDPLEEEPHKDIWRWLGFFCFGEGRQAREAT
jgi:hypothetical protein